MASIVNDPGGRRRIQFAAPDGKRKTLRLGKTSLKTAEFYCHKVECLLEASISKRPLDRATAQWVADLESKMADRLAAVGLIEKRPSAALGEFIDHYTEGRAKLKGNTKRNYGQSRRLLVEFFGESRLLSSITPGEADSWREHLLSKGLSMATVSREVKRAKQFFRAAVRSRLLYESPFVDVKGGPQENRARFYFVPCADIDKVLEACPDNDWRLIVVLARYGGLRSPSEVLALRWIDVDWEHEQLRVRSSKTEHHEGKESRLVPIFPELRPYLDVAWEQAVEGAEFVVSRYRDTNANLRTQICRIIERAGLDPWPKLFQNLRATRETELAHSHPQHVVCAWLGNSPVVANKHYLQVTSDDFAKATQIPTQTIAESGSPKGIELTGIGKNTGKSRCVPSCTSVHIPPRGVEPLFSG